MVYYNSRGMAFTPFNLEVIAVQVCGGGKTAVDLNERKLPRQGEFLLCIKGGN